MKQNAVLRMTVAAMLIAVGITISWISPVRLEMPPASFTLASHVAIFIAMVISPGVGAAVALGTTLGFLLRGVHLVIVLRAASHLLFVLVGAHYLQKHPDAIYKPVQSRVFSLVIGVIHAAAEVAVSTWFYFGGQLGEGYYQSGFVYSVLVLVGVGGVIHSMVDFEIARVLVFVLEKQPGYAAITGRPAKAKAS